MKWHFSYICNSVVVRENWWLLLKRRWKIRSLIDFCRFFEEEEMLLTSHDVSFWRILFYFRKFNICVLFSFSQLSSHSEWVINEIRQKVDQAEFIESLGLHTIDTTWWNCRSYSMILTRINVLSSFVIGLRL